MSLTQDVAELVKKSEAIDRKLARIDAKLKMLIAKKKIIK